MKKRLLVAAFVLLNLSGCVNENSRPKNTDSNEKSIETVQNIEFQTIATELRIPWSINKSGETFFISERDGTVAVVEKGKISREEVRFDRRLSKNPEAGFLGFVLMPDFEKTQKALAYYTYERNGQTMNRVIELQRSNGQWQEKRVLLDGIPSDQFHHGGRLKIGPDFKLYVTTGDAHREEIAQDRDSLGGKILRMNLDGSIPDDNPFDDSYVYSYGHRNPQGLAWNEKNELFESEHGPAGHDELNKIEAGKNYGWPLIVGDERKQGMEAPLIHSGEGTWAPSGIAYKDGKLYVAALRGEAVKMYDLRSGEMKDIITGVGRVRDLFIEGNTLYFISNNTDGRGNPAEDDDKLYSMPLQ